MSIERAIVKGTLLDQVAFRSMFTAEVTPVGGDTSEILWDVYLEQFWTTLQPILSGGVVIATRELQTRVGTQWQTFDEDAVDYGGTQPAAQSSPNAVAAVLIGKGEGIHAIGRKFVSGVIETHLDVNTWASAAVTVLAQALVYYIAPVTGVGSGTLVPGILNKNGVFHRFVGGYLSSFIGSMRRRKPGNGM
jgi:hypothetical protein